MNKITFKKHLGEVDKDVVYVAIAMVVSLVVGIVLINLYCRRYGLCSPAAKAERAAKEERKNAVALQKQNPNPYPYSTTPVSQPAPQPAPQPAQPKDEDIWNV